MERMMSASVEKGPTIDWPYKSSEDGVSRLKEYVELTPAEAIQADCDIKAINIILQGLPTEIYALVSQHRVAKDLWEKIKLLMQGTSLTKQEHAIGAVFRTWHTTNLISELHAHLQQHERHANEVRLMHERNPDPLALVASHQLTQPAYQSHLHTHPQSLSQHHDSSNPRQQATIYDGKVTCNLSGETTTYAAEKQGNTHQVQRSRLPDIQTSQQSSPPKAAYQPMIWMPMTLIVRTQFTKMLSG
ncbi:hypothetical protein Tco_0796643 [Tanacetum coccineum]